MANLKDVDWIGRSFMVPGSSLTSIDKKIREGTEVSLQFIDTAPGGSFVCNPLPQPCDFADLRIPGRFNSQDTVERRVGNIKANAKAVGGGLTRIYGEVFSAHEQRIYLRFGLARFNSLTQFFGNFYNPSMSSVARTGKAPGFFYSVGSIAGTVTTIPLMPLVMAGRMIRFFLNKPRSKYMYVEPNPAVYWSAVNTMFNGIAANLGWRPRGTEPGVNLSNQATDGVELTAEIREQMHQFMPDVFDDNGNIDVFRIANRAQRLGMQQYEQIVDILDVSTSAEDARTKIAAYFDNTAESNLVDRGRSFDAFINDYMSRSYNQTESSKVDAAANDTDTWTSKLQQFITSGEADVNDGSMFVGFRVNHVGTVSESLTNNTKTSPLAESMNSAINSAREKRFSLADGNIGDGLFDIVEKVGGAIGDLTMGFLDKIQLSGVAAFAGRAFVDIPDMYDTTDVEFPTTTFTIPLRSPYGNVFSQLMAIYLPFSMIFCGAAPLATGRQSWTSPMLCEMFFQGHQQIRTGVIKNITIERGTGNIGWNKEGRALGIDITFTVADLSKALFMPVKPDAGPLDSLQALFDDDNNYTDYLATLGSLSLQDQIYVGKKLRINVARMMGQFDQYFSPNRMALITAGTLPGQVLSAMARGVIR